MAIRLAQFVEARLEHEEGEAVREGDVEELGAVVVEGRRRARQPRHRPERPLAPFRSDRTSPVRRARDTSGPGGFDPWGLPRT